MKRSVDRSRHIRLVRATALVAAIAAGDALAQGDPTAPPPDLVPIASRMLEGTVAVRNAGSTIAGASIATIVCSTIDGGVCAQSMMMTRFANPAYPDAIVVAMPAIAAGDVYNYRLPFWDTLVWPDGEFRLTVRADASRSIAESDEGNNEASAIITKP